MPVSASRRHLLPDLALLGIAAVWGGSYLATQQLATTLGVIAVLCARFLPAALVLGAIVLGRRGPSLRRSLRAGSVLGGLRAATIVLETVGVTMTSATNAGLIIGLSILLTPVLESWATGRRLTPGLISSVLLALGGIALLVGGDGFASVNPGDALILVAAITRATLGVAEAKAARAPGADLLGLTTVEIALGAALFTAVGGAPLLARLPEFTAATWGLVVFLALGCTVFAFLGQLWATSRTSASRAGLMLGSEPGWVLIIGVVIGGERIGPLGWIGAAVLLVAMVWGRRAELHWRVPDPAESTQKAPSAPRKRPYGYSRRA